MKRTGLLLLAAWACGACSPAGTARNAHDAGAAADGGSATDAGTQDAAGQDAGGSTTEDAGMTASTTRVRLLITLGSSSTQGAGASSTATRYVNMVAEELGATLVNLGTGGQTHVDVASTYLARALDALDAGPPPDGAVDVVTFLPFTDFARFTAPQVAAGYAPILGRLDQAHAWVVFGIPTVDARYQCGLAGPLRGPDGECYPAELVEEYATKGDAMRVELALHPSASPADVPQAQAQHPEWIAPDGHPNDIGHAFIARCFVHAIRTRMGQDAGPPPEP